MSTDHTDHTDGNIWLQMNTEMTDITPTDAHEQEYPQNTPSS